MPKVKIYTDGAVKNNGGEGTLGMAAILIYTKPSGEVRILKTSHSQPEEYATNNKAELGAILLGLNEIKEAGRASVELQIYSDSQWAIKSITGEFKVTKNIDLIRSIRTKLKEYKGCEFIWVEGHNGDKWNEEANTLAQKAAGTWKAPIRGSVQASSL